jgi:hypothetical protein
MDKVQKVVYSNNTPSSQIFSFKLQNTEQTVTVWNSVYAQALSVCTHHKHCPSVHITYTRQPTTILLPVQCYPKINSFTSTNLRVKIARNQIWSDIMVSVQAINVHALQIKIDISIIEPKYPRNSKRHWLTNRYTTCTVQSEINAKHTGSGSEDRVVQNLGFRTWVHFSQWQKGLSSHHQTTL